MKKPQLKKLHDDYVFHLSQFSLDRIEKETQKRMKIFIERLGAKTPIDMNSFMKKFKKIRFIYEFYILQLSKKLESNSSKIERIIIFESPPESGNHFLLNGGNYFSCFSDYDNINLQIIPNNLFYDFREFIFKECDLNFRELFIEIDEHRFQWKAEAYDFLRRLTVLLDSNIFYFDLLMLPCSFKKSREQWKKDPNLIIKDKRIPVLLLEWALIFYKNKLEEKLKDFDSIFSNNCLVAFGTPLNTSISIFEYYVDKLLKINQKIEVDISRINSPTAFKKMNTEGSIFPLFKSNVVSSSNGPSRELVKNAFNLPSEY
jgi:hypothetical protein